MLLLLRENIRNTSGNGFGHEYLTEIRTDVDERTGRILMKKMEKENDDHFHWNCTPMVRESSILIVKKIHNQGGSFF